MLAMLLRAIMGWRKHHTEGGFGGQQHVDRRKACETARE